MTTPTQGEHAQTEALDAAQTLEYWAKDLKGLLGSELLFAATKLRSLHAQVAALTAAPSVSDGLRTLHDAILNRLSHAELLEKAHYLMELNSNQARTIGELQDLVEAATAQPAAPQGVAYAELPDEHAAFETWARLRSDWRPNLERKGDGYVGAFADEAWRGWSARASNGQAPAGASKFADVIAVQRSEAEADPSDAYMVGLYNGMSMMDANYRNITDWEPMSTVPKPTTTAQAAPAAGAVAGPEDVQRARIIAAIAQRWIGDRTHLGALVYLDDLAWALKTLAAAPTPAAQADSRPAPVREEEREAFKAAHRHLELDEVPDAWGRPTFKHSHVEASWLGWIARAARKQGAKHD